MKNPKISLIVSTYNWPDALETCLMSINTQTVLPDEIVIADDGSTGETALCIERLKREMKVPVFHCWQPDEGFRLAKIRNKAIEICHFPYIVQIDGDVICHNEFVRDHLSYQHTDFFVSGKRINLNADDTQLSLVSKKLICSKKSLGENRLSRRIRCIAAASVLKHPYINNFFNKGVLGSNMAYWLNHARAIGGYNERIEGWGKEDDEFAQRLINYGIRKRGLRFGALEYHLKHKYQSAATFQINNEILKQACSAASNT